MAAASSTDEVLLRRFAAGDPGGLDELFRRHRAVAYRVAYRLLGNEADALDAVQDGFAKALTHLDRFVGRSSFKTWLLRVVSNAALDIGRTRQRLALRLGGPVGPDDPVLAGSLPPPTADLERADLRGRLDRALATLPPQQRLTFVLHADGGLTYREVADALGISVGTVMSRVFYARQRLKTQLADLVAT